MAIRTTETDGRPANSYITLARAEQIWDDQWERREHYDAVTDEDDIDDALVSATALLELLDWDGITSVAGQDLAWPRDLTVSASKPGNNTGRPITIDGTTPREIEFAQAELAFHLLQNPGLLTDTGGILTNSSLQAGAIQLDGLVGASTIPRHVINPIRKYLRTGGTNRVYVGG